MSPSQSHEALAALNGERGDEAQVEALWHLLEAMINLEFDAFMFVSSGQVKYQTGFLFT